jgi:hypothetical protein
MRIYNYNINLTNRNNLIYYMFTAASHAAPSEKRVVMPKPKRQRPTVVIRFQETADGSNAMCSARDAWLDDLDWSSLGRGVQVVEAIIRSGETGDDRQGPVLVLFYARLDSDLGCFNQNVSLAGSIESMVPVWCTVPGQEETGIQVPIGHGNVTIVSDDPEDFPSVYLAPAEPEEEPGESEEDDEPEDPEKPPDRYKYPFEYNRWLINERYQKSLRATL